jgi:DNA-binding transcriptional LysR family regulator
MGTCPSPIFDLPLRTKPSGSFGKSTLLQRRYAKVQSARMYDWDDLRVFTAVARCGSTMAASRDLEISQTTVARRLDRLERQLGVELFQRQQSGCLLTSSGAELLPFAERVQAEAEVFGDRAAQRTRGVSGIIRVTTNEVFANLILTPALAEFAELHPGIRVQLIVTNEMLDLIKGEADIAVRAGVRPTGDGLLVRTLGVSSWAFYCAAGYASAQGMPKSLDELKLHNLVAGEGSIAGAPAIRWVLDNCPPGKIQSYSNSLSNLVVAIRSGLGIGPLPIIVGDREPELIRCFPPVRDFDGEVLLVSRADLSGLPPVRAFKEFIAPRIASLRQSLAEDGW